MGFVGALLSLISLCIKWDPEMQKTYVFMERSSSGLGFWIFDPKTWVRFPYALNFENFDYGL